MDTSLFEAGLALSAWEATEYWFTGQIPRGLGTAHRLNAPYQAFRASDGHFTVGAANNNLFPRFCALLGLDHLVKDPRFDTVAHRLQHRAALEPLIEAVTIDAAARPLAGEVRGGRRAGRARSTACRRRSTTPTRGRAAWCRSCRIPGWVA